LTAVNTVWKYLHLSHLSISYHFRKPLPEAPKNKKANHFHDWTLLVG
jgi:hypothetical protein